MSHRLLRVAAIAIGIAWTSLVQPPAASAIEVARDTLEADTTEAGRRPSRFYYGGTVSVSFSGRVGYAVVQPLVGYKLTPKVSLGAKVGYEYLSDRRPEPDRVSHNYGGGLFARYRFIPAAFAHAEFAIVSYDLSDRRQSVPFMWIGGGYAREIAPRTWFVVEVLLDLIQDGDSPYDSAEPRVTAGIHMGF